MFVDPDKPLPPDGPKVDTLGSVLEGIIEISNARQEIISTAEDFEKETTEALATANAKIDKMDAAVRKALSDHTNLKGPVHGETKTTVGLPNKENWRPATMQEHKLGQSKDTFVVPNGMKELVKTFLTIEPTNYIRSRLMPVASGGQLGNIPQWPFNWKDGEVIESFLDPMAYYTDTPWQFDTSQGVSIYPAMNGASVLTQHVNDPGRVKRAVTPWGGTSARIYNSTLDLRRTRPGVLRGESNDEPNNELVKGSNHLFDKHSVFYADNGTIGVRAFNKVRLPFDLLLANGNKKNWDGILEARENTIYNIYTRFEKGNVGGFGNSLYLVIEIDLYVFTENGMVVKDGPGRPAETIANLGQKYGTLTYQMANNKFRILPRTGKPNAMCLDIRSIVSFTDAQIAELWDNLDHVGVGLCAFTWLNRLNGDFALRIPMGWYSKDKTKYTNYYMDINFGSRENTVNKTATINVSPLRDINTNIQTMDSNFQVKPTGRFIEYSASVAGDVFHPRVFKGIFESMGGHISTYTYYNRQYVGYYKHNVTSVGDWIGNGDNIKPELVKYHYGLMSTLNNDGFYGDHLRHIPMGVNENGTMDYLTQVRDWNQQYRWCMANVNQDTAPVMLSELGHPYGPWRNSVMWMNPDNARVPDFLITNTETSPVFDVSCLVFNTQNEFKGYARYAYSTTDPNSTVTGVDPVSVDDVILSHLATVGGGWSANHRQLFYFRNRLYFFSQCLSASEWPADNFDCYYGWYNDAYIDADSSGNRVVRINGTPPKNVTVKKMKVNNKTSATKLWDDVLGRDHFDHTDTYLMLMERMGTASKYQLMVNLAPHNNFYFEFELSVDDTANTTDIKPNPNPNDPVFPYTETNGYSIDYDTIISYGKKVPQRLHVNFQTPVMLKKSLWSYRKTPGMYGIFSQSIGTRIVQGGLMNAVQGTDIYPVGSVITIGGGNFTVKNPIAAAESDFKGNDELFVRQNGLNIELYGRNFNPNGHETEPNSGVVPCGFLKNSVFSHYDQDGWRNALLPVLNGLRMNFYGYGSSFPALMGVYGANLPVNRFFLTDKPSVMTYNTAVGRRINVGSAPTVKITVNGTAQAYDGSGVFNIPNNFTGTVEVSITSMTALRWSAGLVELKVIGNTVQRLDFSGSSNFTISAPLPPRITSLAGLFQNATGTSYPNIHQWDTSRVTDFTNCFNGAGSFNQDISNWNTSKGTTFANMFKGAVKFNQPIGKWDTTRAVTMVSMFEEALAFNQNLSNWKTYSVVNMARMFFGCAAFNGNITTWNVSSCSNFVSMFEGCAAFNVDLSRWDTSSATNMSSMFRFTSAFNANIATWNVTGVINMSSMFSNAKAFNKNLSAWRTNSLTNVANMFEFTPNFGKDNTFTLGSWNMSKVTDCTRMFYSSGFNCSVANWAFGENCLLVEMFTKTTAFNQDISSWDVRNVKDMADMFRESGAFVRSIIGWKLDSCTTFDYMFRDSAFRGSVTDWVFSNTLDISMEGMFYDAKSFTGDGTETWNVGKVKTFRAMFYGCVLFDGDLGNWDTSSSTSFEDMFFGCSVFNQDIGKWDLGEAKTMRNMFRQALLFNQDLNDWRMTKATDMSDIFREAHAFNGRVEDWDTSSAMLMNGIFVDTPNFDQPIGRWKVGKVNDFTASFSGSAFNQDISEWNMFGATIVDRMFNSNVNFNQDLSKWNVKNVVSHVDFDEGTPAWVLPKPNFPT